MSSALYDLWCVGLCAVKSTKANKRMVVVEKEKKTPVVGGRFYKSVD